MPPDEGQLSLTPIEQQFAATGLGVKDLPAGISDLTARETKFVVRLLEHGQMQRAALEAGYSEASAAAIASETLRKPKVLRFYRECLGKLSDNARNVTIRVYERSAMLHAKALEAMQERGQADEWLMTNWTESRSKNADSKSVSEAKTYERRRDQAQRAEKHYLTLANQTDTVLAGLLGKLALLLPDGSGMQAAGAITPDLIQQLANERREFAVPLEANAIS